MVRLEICALAIELNIEKETYPEANRMTIIQWFFMKHDLFLNPHYANKK